MGGLGQATRTVFNLISVQDQPGRKQMYENKKSLEIIVLMLYVLCFGQVATNKTRSHFTNDVCGIVSQGGPFQTSIFWVRNIWFLFPLVPSKREKNLQTETT